MLNQQTIGQPKSSIGSLSRVIVSRAHRPLHRSAGDGSLGGCLPLPGERQLRLGERGEQRVEAYLVLQIPEERESMPRTRLAQARRACLHELGGNLLI